MSADLLHSLSTLNVTLVGVVIICGLMAALLLGKFNVINELLRNPALLLSLIMIFGFILAPGAADVAGLKEDKIGVLSSGKVIRVATVMIGGGAAFILIAFRNSLCFLLRGNLAILIIYFLLALCSVVFSRFKLFSIYKSFEIFTVILVGTTIYLNNDKTTAAKRFFLGILWFYVLTAGFVWAQFFIFGPEAQRQLVGETPFLGFMLTSKYPGMVGNAVGFLGALVTLFGFYVTDSHSTLSLKDKMIGVAIVIMGFIMVFFSYTRSILVFLILSLMLYFFMNRKFIRFSLLLVMIIIPLIIPSTRAKIINHLQRGSRKEAIVTLSGRLLIWKHVLEMDTLQMMVGQGFATGSLFQHYSESKWWRKSIFAPRNVHNSVFEIIMSSGLIGAAVWITLMLTILSQLLRSFIKYNSIMTEDELRFHKLVIVVFILSLMRSTMNATFVYLDYFFFVLIATAVYCNVLSEGTRESEKALETIAFRPDK